MRHILFFILFLESTLLNAQVSETIVWSPSEPGDTVSEHFVYGLAVTNNRDILAFSEARIKPGDASPHHIVMKRSVDGGRHWLPSQIIVESKDGACYANPTPVVDSYTGGVFLFYAKNYDNAASDVYFINSKDDGKTWSDPTTITSLFDNDPYQRRFHLPGPGHGITVKNGRLLLQVWHRHTIKLPAGKRVYGVSTIYSDNKGKTWHSGGYVPQPDSLEGNESRIVELSNGNILMNARPGNSPLPQKRLLSISKDQGLSWSAFTESSQNPFTPVDAGINKIQKRKNTYLLSTYPSGPGRSNLVISVSKDNGKSWSSGKPISHGLANYSDIAVLEDNTILVIYGKGKPKHVAALRIDLDWIKKHP